MGDLRRPNRGPASAVAIVGPVSPLPDAFAGGAIGAGRLPKEVIATRRRRRLLEAAVVVIARRGYTATTLDHILGAAKVGVGTFYELFESKEDLLARAHEHTLAAAREPIVAAIAAESDWGRQVRAALAALLALIAERPLQARFALGEVQGGGPEALARYEGMLAEADHALRRGRGAGALAPGLPEGLEHSLVSGVAWVLQQRILSGGREADVRTLAPQLLAILAEPYLGEEQVRRLGAGD
jgi:AcrR family transcriptional regulator